ncbi:MAG: c-type cytochrome, partial [Verrucomicrobiota bacterium]
GPHGEVYLLDWSDTGECHENTGVHRNSGRIYMISYGEYRRFEGETIFEDVADIRNKLLFNELTHWESINCWKHPSFGWEAERLENLHEPTLVPQIRQAADSLPLDTLASTRVDTEESVSAAKRFLSFPTGPGMVSASNDSPRVRLQLASTLQRLPFDLRKDLAKALVVHAEDADDPNLPLLVWYGLISLADHHPDHLVEIFAACEWPKLRRFIARALTEQLETAPQHLDALLRTPTGPRALARPNSKTDILHGMHQALTGWTKATPPPSWPAFTKTLPADTPHLRDLQVLFGDGRSITEIERIALDPKASRDARTAAVAGLIRAQPDNLKKTLLAVLDVQFVNTPAARGLLALDDPQIPRILIASLGKFHHTERDEVLSLVCSRAASTRVLLERIRDGKFPAKRLRAFHARQIENLGDPELSKLLREVWGNPNYTSEQKAELIRAERQRLTPEVLAEANLDAGKTLYASHCAACHKLHGKGGVIGPDLTGGGRTDLDYLLHNIIDPSAELAPDYRLEVITLTDGTVLSGSVRESTPKTLTIQTPTARRTIEREKIATLIPSQSSLMPEGLLQSLTPDQVRDLIAYLMKK